MTLKTTALAVAFGFAAAAANAATVGLLDSSTNGVGNTADTFASGYFAATPDGATWSSDPTVSSGSVPNSFKSPFANTAIEGTTSYFAVGGESGADGAPSPVTLTLASAVNGLSILWGSIDSFNTISFYNSTNTLVDSFTGADIIAMFGLPGKSSTFDQVAKLYFAADAGEDFKYISFSSTQAAFEFALSEVPVPASGLLLVGGLAGVGALRRRKKA
ncbi:VPLPA-CTERM sorting domain-containing protein [Pseudooceanicola sp. LIPI14-2-Ac024]|uniref:Npun_F0296 family exosortase-dependent surface protein n=1 Tax=Pseudooceanicola sp. LIPI14-2-Ac024 TaxID=3344875 RepID=UPI0035D0F9BE